MVEEFRLCGRKENTALFYVLVANGRKYFLRHLESERLHIKYIHIYIFFKESNGIGIALELILYS